MNDKKKRRMKSLINHSYTMVDNAIDSEVEKKSFIMKSIGFQIKAAAATEKKKHKTKSMTLLRFLTEKFANFSIPHRLHFVPKLIDRLKL